jgi:hypothetical protein
VSERHDDDPWRELRDASEGSELRPAELAASFEALRAAHAPAELDPDVHEALLARALGVATAELGQPAGGGASDADERSTSADRQERERADALRSALEGAPSTPEALALVALARALRYAHQPPELVELRHEALMRVALGRPSKLRKVATVIGFALSAAAAALAVLSVEPARDAPRADLVPVRSTLELFDPAEPFPRSGDETSRIDRIAGARASDLRKNRYATWGVR